MILNMMKRKIFFIAAFLLTLAVGRTWADSARIYVGDFSVDPGEEFELKVMVDADVYVTQAQFCLEIPDGFEFVNKGTERRPVYVNNTENSAGLTCSSNLTGNQLRVFLSDASQIGTEEKSGELAVVYLKAKDDIVPGEYLLKLTDVVASDEKATRFATPDADIKVAVGDIADGITALTFDKAYVDVYTIQGTLAGRRIAIDGLKATLGKGIYIVEGKKIVIR